MEGVVVKMNFWKNKCVLVTGHTGFKGSWLSMYLKQLGAKVIGYSLDPPTNPNMYTDAGICDEVISNIGDILQEHKLKKIICKYNPQVVFHLAAQPIVRKSYSNPIETFEVNIMGTVKLLNALRGSKDTKVIVNVTSDKCYYNKEWEWGYRENDSLGGYDPYSSSKACSELVSSCFRKSFFNEKNMFISTARAGNVIGGGDWAEDRLIPDIIRGITSSKQLIIRNPKAVRPWQHVLEPITGYLKLAEEMYQNGDEFSGAWNFGPSYENCISVEDMVSKFQSCLDYKLKVVSTKESCVHESNLLRLDSSKANTKLKWKPKLNVDEALLWTAQWYDKYLKGEDMKEYTVSQISRYISL